MLCLHMKPQGAGTKFEAPWHRQPCNRTCVGCVPTWGMVPKISLTNHAPPPRCLYLHWTRSALGGTCKGMKRHDNMLSPKAYSGHSARISNEFRVGPNKSLISKIWCPMLSQHPTPKPLASGINTCTASISSEFLGLASGGDGKVPRSPQCIRV